MTAEVAQEFGELLGGDDMTPLPRITDEIDAHAADRPDCRACGGTGLVCEDHPNLPWDDGDGCCGAPGMPCLLIRGET